MPDKPRFWAVIPAAGSGRRMQVDVPKQYLMLAGRPLIEYVLEVFCRHEKISGVIVALSPGDNHWHELSISGHEKITTTNGGVERCHSVLNCLDFLHDIADKDDWVLVHDAARPCINRDDISLMLDMLSGDAVGGLLALPVRDTMKRAGEDKRVIETVDREGLWHALTPQMFRRQMLADALKQAMNKQQLVTDESSAMELAGHKPLLIPGNPRNIKVTHRDDLELAGMYLDNMNTKTSS